MRKIRKRKYNLSAFLKKKGISQRILAKLLKICRSYVSQWIDEGVVPLDQLYRIIRLTKTAINAETKWVKFDVAAFRNKWRLTITQLARELETNAPNIRNWEAAKKIPRTYLAKIRRINERCRCRKRRQKKKCNG